MRAERDELWSAVEAILSGKTASDAVERGRAHAAAVKAADELADRLRREAERVQRAAHLSLQSERAAEALEEGRDELARLATGEESWREHWAKAWSGVLREPASPAEMRGWLVRHDRARRDAAAHAEAAEQSEAHEQFVRGNRERLHEALEALGEAGLTDRDSWSEALARRAASGFRTRLRSRSRARRPPRG